MHTLTTAFTCVIIWGGGQGEKNRFEEYELFNYMVCVSERKFSSPQLGFQDSNYIQQEAFTVFTVHLRVLKTFEKNMCSLNPSS